MPSKKSLTSNQLLFKELFVGTLIYAVVLGFFNDYTDIVEAKSFSILFLAAIILQVLTYLTFLLKGSIIGWLKHRKGLAYSVLMFFAVWLVMFLSKFVFVGAIDLVFGDDMNIYGFFGILLVVLSVTALHKLADYIFKKLGNSETA